MIGQTQKEIKYNKFIDLTCIVPPNLINDPVSWVILEDQAQTPIVRETNEVVIGASKTTKSVKQSHMLHLNVTEEWIGAQVQCGVEYKDPAKPLDSVKRWSSPHRLNGMHTQ